ncbi:hypothetical protein HELRODRAFT_165320 [Helobdella robusta]|uniref:Uncharacterized protein n=1 Tax=Helobdella robusta TaxID=6412 RepID=T1EWL3_HELRO|nr:hypothetical protein HELRODRAFT_165320 [Helobdella robusta]ESN91310.1 hypothetical protein HELRODRAFT_165320 [Helobdella robusta]
MQLLTGLASLHNNSLNNYNLSSKTTNLLLAWEEFAKGCGDLTNSKYLNESWMNARRVYGCTNARAKYLTSKTLKILKKQQTILKIAPTRNRLFPINKHLFHPQGHQISTRRPTLNTEVQNNKHYKSPSEFFAHHQHGKVGFFFIFKLVVKSSLGDRPSEEFSDIHGPVIYGSVSYLSACGSLEYRWLGHVRSEKSTTPKHRIGIRPKRRIRTHVIGGNLCVIFEPGQCTAKQHQATLTTRPSRHPGIKYTFDSNDKKSPSKFPSKVSHLSGVRSCLGDKAALFREALLSPTGEGTGKCVLRKASPTKPSCWLTAADWISIFCGKNIHKSKRKILNFVAWNVRTLLENSDRNERRSAIVARELARFEIDIDALSETRLSDASQFEEKALTRLQCGYSIYLKSYLAK